MTVVISKMGEYDSEIGCIVEHEGFQPVCWVLQLQAAYFAYRSHGNAEEKSTRVSMTL